MILVTRASGHGDGAEGVRGKTADRCHPGCAPGRWRGRVGWPSRRGQLDYWIVQSTVPPQL
ncbi:hypothetical protein MEBOL_006358 [Melittangium boletus DSM 14713]|uniref:Uncharacterized protein n=1 Tax=Melittangium boletus DSM 14713 TaxID=1294270 RepID=A0A250IM95_9BACT|nr:hypothetical protein MEBOL_006358 [Melittangium boletus DSM 14713]